MIRVLDSHDEAHSTLPLAELNSDPSFQQSWASAIASHGDVFMESSYLEAEVKRDVGQIILTKYESALGRVFRAVTLRPIATGNATEGTVDLISPFEYGGPIVVSPSEERRQALVDAAQAAHLSWCRENGIVCEFIRFNPMLKNQVGWETHYDLRLSCDNVTMALETSESEMFNAYSTSQRRNVRLAQREGIICARENLDLQVLKQFHDLYSETMSRREATEEYFFPLDYFSTLAELPANRLSYFTARAAEGDLLCGLLVLKSDRFAHSHLLGSSDAGLKTKATSLLYHHVALEMKSKGLQQFHLGGAAKSQPGVLEFKQRFSERTAPYFVGTRVFNESVYEQLKAQRLSELNLDGTGYFPAYRASS